MQDQKDQIVLKTSGSATLLKIRQRDWNKSGKNKQSRALYRSRLCIQILTLYNYIEEEISLSNYFLFPYWFSIIWKKIPIFLLVHHWLIKLYSIKIQTIFYSQNNSILFSQYKRTLYIMKQKLSIIIFFF